jgi:hypothetical protein
MFSHIYLYIYVGSQWEREIGEGKTEGYREIQ